MTTAFVTGIGVIATALVGLLASRAQIAKLRAEAALTTETVSDRQAARLELEIARLTKVAEYLREDLRDCDKRLRYHKEGWWRTHRAAVIAGADLSDAPPPPFNGEGNP
jgi:homoserine dehydrogenase